MGRKIFVCAEMFSWAQRSFNRQLGEVLKTAGYDPWLPGDSGNPDQGRPLLAQVSHGLDQADLVLAVVDAAEVDPWVWFGIGMAHARNLPILMVKTDFNRRAVVNAQALESMLASGVARVVPLSDHFFDEAVDLVRDFFQDLAL